jgi:nucleoside-diphosphate-sugar epimerase
MDDLSIFGGRGFILSRYAEIYPGFIEARCETTPLYPRILYGISTTTNYNIFDKPHEDINTNLSWLIAVLEETRKQFGQWVEISLLSTWFCYGQIDDLPARENSPCNPTGFYSITARAREQLLISYCSTYGMKWRIFRLANVIGEGDKKISARKNALQFLIKEMVNNKPIKIYYDGRNIRDYIYVDDVCKAINLGLDAPLNEIYNISNGEPLCFIDLIRYCANKIGYNQDMIEFIDGTDFHKLVQVKSMYLDNQKIKRLGYKPSMNIWQSLDKIVDYYKNGN